jgi:hypothetical protein
VQLSPISLVGIAIMVKETPDASAPAPVVKKIPLAQVASDLAPIIYFENIDSHGIGGAGQIANLTLEALRHTSSDTGFGVTTERVIVAHLRFPIAAIAIVEQALNQIKLMAAPAATSTSN